MQSSMSQVFDKLAVGLSAICIVHCLAFPILMLAAPTFLVQEDHGDLTHMVLLILAVPLSIFGMWYGYKTHKRLRYAFWAIGGIATLIIGLSLHGLAYEVYVTVSGALILAFAHLGNRFAVQRFVRA